MIEGDRAWMKATPLDYRNSQHEYHHDWKRYQDRVRASTFERSQMVRDYEHHYNRFPIRLKDYGFTLYNMKIYVIGLRTLVMEKNIRISN